MTLLTPLGLLGLLSLIILIIIYIIKPNYQQRIISSTYIWRLSLKYKKKRVPINKLRNVLLIVCQILILSCCAVILAQPGRILLAKETGEESVIILDTSASMRHEVDTGDGVKTRFQRAVTDAIDLAADTFRNNGKVTVILAKEEPEYVLSSRLTYDNANALYKELNTLAEDPYVCSYGSCDIDKALSACEDIILINDSTKVFLYTDTTYIHVPHGVTVMNDVVLYDDATDPERNEWNVAILDARAEYEDNYYNYYVDVVCYGRSYQDLNVRLTLTNVNGGETPEYVATAKVSLEDGVVTTLAFRKDPFPSGQVPKNTVLAQLNDGSSFLGVYLFGSARVSIQDETDKEVFYDDGFYEDNEFYIYGGLKSELKIQYVSSVPNPFINGAILAVRSKYEQTWDISLDNVMFIQEAASDGYDLYIYELEQVPSALPTDGVSLVISPENSIGGSGVNTGEYTDVTVSGGVSLTKDTDHPLLKNINESNILVTRFLKTFSYDDQYTSILSILGQPMILVANDSQNKAVFVNFDLHYSNWPLTVEFPVFMMNFFEYYFPPMVDSNSFEVGESVNLKARGDAITVEGPEFSQSYTAFPASFNVKLPGTYTLTQDTFGGNMLTEKVFVRIPASESNTHPELDTMLNPFAESNAKDYYKDLMMYVAIGLTALMFAEWILQLRDNM